MGDAMEAAQQVCKWGCGHSFASYWVWLYHEKKECRKRPKNAVALRAWFVARHEKAKESYRYWMDNEIHTRPVALSLAVASAKVGIEHLEGRTKGIGLHPFYCRLQNGKGFCKPQTLHRYVDGLLGFTRLGSVSYEQ